MTRVFSRFSLVSLGVAAWLSFATLLWAAPELRVGVVFDIPVQEDSATNGKAKAFLFRDGNVLYLHVMGTDGTVTTYRVTDVQSPLPPKPKPESALAKWVREQVASVPKYADLSLALADTFSSISSRIRRGELKTPLEIIEATAAANAKILDTPEKITAWAAFREALRQKLNAMSESGELKTPEDHARVWDEIAEGLRNAVANP